MNINERNRLANEAFQLQKSGELLKAIALYSKAIAGGDNAFLSFNRGIAYLEARELDDALFDFERAAELAGPKSVASGHYIYQGVVHWHLNQDTLAIDRWKAALEAPYTDAAGGVDPPALLYYAAVRKKDDSLMAEAMQILRKLSTAKRGIWPAAIAHFLLGDIGASALEREAKGATAEGLKARWLCKAHFHIGSFSLHNGDLKAFRDRMMRCTANRNAILAHEYHLAKWEAEREFPEKAFP